MVKSGVRGNKAKNKVIFVNGVFDIVHPGHLALLRFAKNLGGTLVVGINSDKIVRKLKGKGHPINNEKDRKIFLESLGWIDRVVIFDELRTGKVARKIKVDVVVRGGKSTHTPEETRIIDGLPKHVKIVRFKKRGDFSTTNIIKKILKKK